MIKTLIKNDLRDLHLSKLPTCACANIFKFWTWPIKKVFFSYLLGFGLSISWLASVIHKGFKWSTPIHCCSGDCEEGGWCSHPPDDEGVERFWWAMSPPLARHAKGSINNPPPRTPHLHSIAQLQENISNNTRELFRKEFHTEICNKHGMTAAVSRDGPSSSWSSETGL